MTNEYGAALDSNGYAPSILGAFDFCGICYKKDPLQRHEVFHGSNRKKSKRFGLWIHVCPACHHEIHFTDGKLDRRLKEHAQRQAMLVYGWDAEEWRRRFGKSYL